jgi:hypothetical protein
VIPLAGICVCSKLVGGKEIRDVDLQNCFLSTVDGKGMALEIPWIPDPRIHLRAFEEQP